jgi:hypothetical protein
VQLAQSFVVQDERSPIETMTDEKPAFFLHKAAQIRGNTGFGNPVDLFADTAQDSDLELSGVARAGRRNRSCLCVFSTAGE